MEKNKELSERARTLRKSMTKEEQKLWKLYLCRCQPRFHRQYVIGNYIADFYCHKAKLVVELDGSQHYTPEEKQYDEKGHSICNHRDCRYCGLAIWMFCNAFIACARKLIER